MSSDAELLKNVGFVASFYFLNIYIKMSEASDFTAVKAAKHCQEIYEKLVDLDSTGNEVAPFLVTKMDKLQLKNKNLTKVANMARGEGISAPSDIGIYSFCPCTSVHVERLFYVLNAFLHDRNFILEQTVLKLIFIKYNQVL